MKSAPGPTPESDVVPTNNTSSARPTDASLCADAHDHTDLKHKVERQEESLTAADLSLSHNNSNSFLVQLVLKMLRHLVDRCI